MESGSSRRMVAWLRRGILRGLHSVERTALLAVRDAGGVEGAADHLVADARKVLDAAATDEDDRVLLKVVPLTGDVAGHLEAVGEPDTGDFGECRFRFFRRHGRDARAAAPPL